jgi:hypothetical protein
MVTGMAVEKVKRSLSDVCGDVVERFAEGSRRLRGNS